MDARSNGGKAVVYYTMVSRWFNPQNKKDLMSSRFGVISSAFQMSEMSGQDIFNAIKRGATFTNMEIDGGKLVVCNGSVDKYTTFNGGDSILVSEYRAVILGRVEANGKLAGYVLYDANGAIRKIRTAEAAEMAKNGLIANGKVRETQTGPIVSSIKGEYPIINIEIAKKRESAVNRFESCSITLLYFGECTHVGSSDKVKYAGAIVKCKDMLLYRDIADSLAESCNKTVKMAIQLGNKNAEKELACIRMGDNACFGAFGLNTFMSLVEKGAVVTLKDKTSIISQVYDKEDNREESYVHLAKKGTTFDIQAGKSEGEASKHMAVDSANKYMKYLAKFLE